MQCGGPNNSIILQNWSPLETKFPSLYNMKEIWKTEKSTPTSFQIY